MKLYLAGPMTGYEDFNRATFTRAAEDLRSAGYDVVSPAELDAEDETLTDESPWQEFLKRDLRLLVGCDAVALLPGWQDSKGATLEQHVAASLSLPTQPVADWMRDKGALPGTYVGTRTGAPSGDGEVRVTNPDTGGQKGTKPARFDLIPAVPLWALAEVYGRGAEKYEPRNWERGYAWSLSFAAMQRHAWAFWRGEDLDPELGLPHLALATFHAFALIQFASTHPELDDRPGGQP